MGNPIHQSVFEDRARHNKATALAREIYRDMLKVVASADEAMRENVADRAGVNKPSVETWAVVLEILKGRNVG